ncbi:MAG: PEP-CTERM sorting domain-containing protein [Sphingobium sp.]
MKARNILLAAGVVGLMGVAAPAQATKKCWYKCGGSSSGGHSSSGGNTSTGGATPIPEPGQMGLFAMGIAVVGYRMFRVRRKK